MIRRILLKLGVCTLGGVLVAWCVVGGIVSVFFSTKVMPKREFIEEHSEKTTYGFRPVPSFESNEICLICSNRIVDCWLDPEMMAGLDPLEVGFGPILDRYSHKDAWRYIVRVKYRPNWEGDVKGFVVFIGLLCGIVWSIEHGRAKRRFGLMTGAGVMCSFVSGLFGSFGSVMWQILVVFLFVGIVSALASIGAFSKK